MDDIEIPECNDGEWQSKMLRELSKRLEDIEIELQIADRINVAPLMRAQKIVEALREYSGF